MVIIKITGDILHLSNSQVLKANATASSDIYLDNPKTMLILKSRVLVKEALTKLGVSRVEKGAHDRIFRYHLKKFEQPAEG